MAGVAGMSSFAGDPQPVEVLHRGVWWSGELLGWRFEPDGRCVTRVRCVIDGLRHTAWMDLGDVRLPERERRVPETAIPGLPPRRTAPHRTSPAPAQGRGRHRVPDDDTQPHLLLTAAFTGRPSPGGLRLPPPRLPLPPVGSEEHLSTV